MCVGKNIFVFTIINTYTYFQLIVQTIIKYFVIHALLGTLFLKVYYIIYYIYPLSDLAEMTGERQTS